VSAASAGAGAPSILVCALSHPDSHRRPRLLTGSTHDRLP